MQVLLAVAVERQEIEFHLMHLFQVAMDFSLLVVVELLLSVLAVAVAIQMVK